MFPLSRQLPTLTKSSQSLRLGWQSPRDVLQVARGALANFEPKLQAWAYVARDESSASTLASDEPRGRLQGLPVGIKDIIHVAGQPTKAGFLRSSDSPALVDAPIVAALRKEGATIVGKTATCQFACFDPAPTLNPWDFTRTPGGSSAGSAVAVAVGQCLLALGTQTGGSILRPASYCGVSGFKPAFDAQWLDGVLPVSSRLDHVGPIARTVNDLLLAWRAICGPECDALGPRLRQPPRLGVLREYFWEHSSPDVRQCVDAALERWRAAGAQIADVPLPAGFSDVHRAHLILMTHDCAQVHRDNYAANRTGYLPQISALIEEGLQIEPDLVERAAILQGMFRQHLYHTYPEIDVLVMPTTPAPAPTRETTGDARFLSPWSFSGVPAISFPVGLSQEGLPCGVQLVHPHGGSRREDFELLSIAAWCDECLGLDMLSPLVARLERHFPDTLWIDNP